MWVVDRVHSHTTNGWALALPTHTASFTPVDVALLGVANFADRCTAASVDVADFARWHTQLCVWSVLSDKLNTCTCGTSDLGSTTWAKFDCVNHSTDWDVAKWHVIARLDVRTWTSLDAVTLLELVRRNDVTLFAICVMQKCDASGAVWIVFDVRNLRWHTILVCTTEVDYAVCTLVSATLVTSCYTTLVVTTTLVR
jgi:hypothetical protein